VVAGTVRDKLALARRRERERLIQGVRDVVAAADPAPDRVILFGSLARGDFDGRSDLDILVVGRDALAHDALADLGHPIDVVPMTHDEWTRRRANGDAFIRRILDEGIVIRNVTNDGAQPRCAREVW
jgi:predicted nucleotidyltransferase